MAKKTDEKHELFVLEYIANDFNGSKAAIAAGYSARTAGAASTRLLKNVKVQALLKRHLKERKNSLEITADRVLEEMARLAFFDVRKLFDDDGYPIHISNLDDDTAAAIVGVDVVTKGNNDTGYADVMKIKLVDKKGALELLGKRLSLFTDKTEVSGELTVTSTVDDKDREVLKHFFKHYSDRIKPEEPEPKK